MTDDDRHHKPPLDYEPGSRREGFWGGVPVVVKVFLAIILAAALTRAALWIVWMTQQ